MPKTFHEITRWDGGLNTHFDESDIDATELSAISNWSVSKPGRIYTITGQLHSLNADTTSYKGGTDEYNLDKAYGTNTAADIHTYLNHIWQQKSYQLSDGTTGQIQSGNGLLVFDADYPLEGNDYHSIFGMDTDTRTIWSAVTAEPTKYAVVITEDGVVYLIEGLTSAAETIAFMGTSGANYHVIGNSSVTQTEDADVSCRAFWAEGALRISETSHSSGSRVKWFGRCIQKRFGGTTYGRYDRGFNRWSFQDASLDAPEIQDLADLTETVNPHVDKQSHSDVIVNHALPNTVPGWFGVVGDFEYYPTGDMRGKALNLSLTPSTGEDDGGWEATNYEFSQTLVYQGNQESLPALMRVHKNSFDGSANKSGTDYSQGYVPLAAQQYWKSIQVHGAVNPGAGLDYNDRVTGARIYIRKHNSNKRWTLFLDCDFTRGVRQNTFEDFNVDWSNSNTYAAKCDEVETYSGSTTIELSGDGSELMTAYFGDPSSNLREDLDGFVGNTLDSGQTGIVGGSVMRVVGRYIWPGTKLASITDDDTAVLTNGSYGTYNHGGGTSGNSLTFENDNRNWQFKTSGYADTGLSDIKNPSPQTYESINGFSPENTIISFESAGQGWEDAIVLNRRCFAVGMNYMNKDSGQTELMSDRLFYSAISKYDTFPVSNWIDIGINDGESFKALAGLANRLLAFKETTLYIINVQNPNDGGWFLEAELKGMGVSGPNSIAKTDKGIIFANVYGLYVYDAQGIPLDVTPKIDKATWKADLTAANHTITVGYDGTSEQVIIGLTGTIDADAQAPQDAQPYYVYDIKTQSFVRHEKNMSDDMTNFANITDTGELIWMGQGQIGQNHDGEFSFKKYTSNDLGFADASQDVQYFTTKLMDFGSPALMKKFYNLYVDIKSSGTYNVDFIVNGTTVNKTGSGSSYTKIKVDISGASNSTTFQLKVLNKADVDVSINSISLEYRTLYKRVT